MPLLRRPIAAAVAIALAAILAACGGTENPETDDPPVDADTEQQSGEVGNGAETETIDGDTDDVAAGDDDLETLVVGASPVPHSDILAFVRDQLDLGFALEIVEFTDYIQPNVALHEGDLDANYFQHQPYLTQQLLDNPNYDFTPVAGVHIEPLAVYSSTIDNLDDLPKDAQIAVPNDPPNLGRALWLLEAAGVLTVADTGDELPTEHDIEDNPRAVTILPAEAAALPSVLPDVAAAVINGNYALEAGLSPAGDGLAVESGHDNPYANFLVVRAGDETDPRIVALGEALTSEDVRDFLAETFTDGTVIPAS